MKKHYKEITGTVSEILQADKSGLMYLTIDTEEGEKVFPYDGKVPEDLKGKHVTAKFSITPLREGQVVDRIIHYGGNEPLWSHSNLVPLDTMVSKLEKQYSTKDRPIPTNL